MKKRTPRTTSKENLLPNDLYPVSSLALQLIGDIELIYNRQVNVGDDLSISTGFPDLDDKIGCLHRGTLLVITTPNDQMRDAFCFKVIQHVALRLCQPVLYYRTQESFLRFSRKLIDDLADIASEASIYDGKLSPEEFQRLSTALVELSNAPIFTNQMELLGLDHIYDATKIHHQKTGSIGLVLVDFLQYISDSNPLAAIIKLKEIASELNVPVIALHKLYPPSYIQDLNIPVPKKMLIPALVRDWHSPSPDALNFPINGYFEQVVSAADATMLMSGSPDEIVFDFPKIPKVVSVTMDGL